MLPLRPLAAAWLLLLLVPDGLGTPRYNNGFYYHDISNGHSKEESRYTP